MVEDTEGDIPKLKNQSVKMKIKIILLLVFVFSIPLACSKGEKTKVKIGKTAAEKIKLPEKLKVTEDLKKIRDAIVVYRNLNDCNPSSLEELNLDLYYPNEYIYDAEKGTVKPTQKKQ